MRTADRIAGFLRYAAIQFIVLSGCAMVTYAGGTWFDAAEPRYQIGGNFLSDLGMTHAFSGRANYTSCVLFGAALVSIGADIGLPNADFRSFSLTVFLGLLAYDWLRILIWFDNMGLRVATLVNLTFVGGDRVDEAAGRFLGASQRTRAIPDGIRRFSTWAPLLIPFYIPRGADWDTAWTGAETLRNAKHNAADQRAP